MRAKETFSSSISQVNNSTRRHGVSIGRLFKLLDRRSNYIISFVAFFLIVLPLPTPPGFSIILALPAIFITMQMCYKHERIWLPKILTNIKISKNIVKTIDEVSRKYLEFIEKCTRKRFMFIVSPKLQRLYDILLLIFAICAAVPIPFICMVPAIAGLLLSAGLIVKDGILAIISLFVGLFGISLIYLSIKTFMFVKDYLPI